MSSTSMASSSERLGPLLVATDSMARLISEASVTILTISQVRKAWREVFLGERAPRIGDGDDELVVARHAERGEEAAGHHGGVAGRVQEPSQNSATLGKNGRPLILAMAAMKL
jgi:hypothetical protein